MKIESLKIIPGGQTGADRAGLDWAIQHGVPHGGWRPKGRKAEDGPIPKWIQQNNVHVLNVAGPRASKEPKSAEFVIATLIIQ